MQSSKKNESRRQTPEIQRGKCYKKERNKVLEEKGLLQLQRSRKAFPEELKIGVVLD